MKQWCVFMIAIFFVFIVPVSALSTTLAPTYRPSETIIIRIDGAITQPIAASQIELLRGHVSMPFVYEVQQLGTQEYLWGTAPEGVDNYTLVIKNVAVQDGSGVATQDYYANFSVRGNKSEYAVTPGFVSTSADFNLEIISYIDTTIQVPISFPYPREVTVAPGKTTIPFSIVGVKTNQIIPIVIGRYTVPLYIRGNGTTVSPPISEGAFEFIPSDIRQTLAPNEPMQSYQVTLLNHRPVDIKKLVLDYNKDILTIEPSSFTLPGNGSIILNVSVKKKLSVERTQESVYVRVDNDTAVLLLNVGLEQDTHENTSANTTTLGNATLYCAQLSGVLCASTDTCSGRAVTSKEGGICCVGTCVAAVKPSSAWIGWLLGALGIVILAYVWFVYRAGRGMKKDPLARKVAEAEKRVP